MGPEAFLENEVRKFAKKLGGKSYKWKSRNVNGVPDRIFTHWRCGPFAIEFKKNKNEGLTDLQFLVCRELAENGMRVYGPVGSLVQAKEIVEDEFLGRPKRHQPMDDL